MSTPDNPTDDSASARESDEVRDYDAMLTELDVLLDEAMRKVESGRVYDAENERVRIKWIRVATQVVDTARKVRSDRDLAELSDRVEQLENRDDPDLADLYE